MSAVLSTVAPGSAAAGPDQRERGALLSRYDEALRAGLMGPRLAALTAASSSTCHVLDGKFEPGVRAVVLYSLAGRLFRGDLLTATEFDGAMVVPPGVLVSPFPADPEMPALARVVDPAELGAAVSRALPSVGGGRRVPRCRVTVLRYRPGKRATVLVSLSEGHQYVAKAYHDPAKAEAVARDSRAVSEDRASAPEVRLAPMLVHLTDLAVVVQGRVAGVPLTALLEGPRGPVRDTPTAVRRAARAVAALHATRVGLTRERSTERELRRFGQRAARVATVAPRLGESLAGLATRLVDTQRQLPPPLPGPVHGDCKPSQFLLTDRDVVLLDLDHVGVSDQAGDVGTFLASLRQLAVRHRLSPSRGDSFDALTGLGRLFLEAYGGARGAGVDPVRARWHEVVALERKALRAFARAPRSPLAGALTAEAHRCLDELEGT